MLVRLCADVRPNAAEGDSSVRTCGIVKRAAGEKRKCDEPLEKRLLTNRLPENELDDSSDGSASDRKVS